VNAQANPGIDFLKGQNGFHQIAESRRAARRDLEKYLKEKARAEYDYRKVLAREFAVARHDKKSVVEADVYAKGKAAGAAFSRDMADAKAKAAQARLAELEGERASLRQLIDWTREES
jgi:uncharacterized protein (DUF3084 family)